MPQLAQADDFRLSEFERSIAQKFASLEEYEEFCRLCWERLDRKRLNFVRAAGLGRKKQIIVRISETHGVKITNQFQGAHKVFTPAFCRRLDISKIKLPA